MIQMRNSYLGTTSTSGTGRTSRSSRTLEESGRKRTMLQFII